jgi:hypothetical protein
MKYYITEEQAWLEIAAIYDAWAVDPEYKKQSLSMCYRISHFEYGKIDLLYKFLIKIDAATVASMYTKINKARTLINDDGIHTHDSMIYPSTDKLLRANLARELAKQSTQ